MHEIWQELLPFYAAGQLAADENALFQAHLATCARCQADLKIWQALADAIREDTTTRLTDELPPLSRAIFDTPQDDAQAFDLEPQPLIWRSHSESLPQRNASAVPQPTRGAGFADDGATVRYAAADAQPNDHRKRTTSTQTAVGRRSAWYSAAAAVVALLLFGVVTLLMGSALSSRENAAQAAASSEQALDAARPSQPAFASPGSTRLATALPLVHSTPVMAVERGESDPLASITPSQIDPIISFPARLLASTRLPQGDVSQRLAWSPDGERLALAGTRGVWLYEADTLNGLATLLVDSQDSVISVAFSPDGSTLAAINWAQTIRLWDVATTQERGLLLATPLWDGLQYSPNGRWLLSGSVNGSISVIDALQGTVVKEIAVGAGGYNAVISPDGRTLAVGNYRADASIWLYDLQTGTPVRQLLGHRSEVRRLAFNADGTLLASGDLTGTVRVWEVATGSEKHIMQQSGVVLGIAFDATGVLVAATMKLSETLHGVWVWNLRDDTQWAAMVNDTALSGPAFSPTDAHLAISSGDGRVWVLDLTQAQRGLFPTQD